MLINVDASEALQLQREAERVGFRPATLRGMHPSELRARALEPPPQITLGRLALAIVLVSGGFFLGRALVAHWRRQKSRSSVGVGLDVFVASR